MSPLSKVAHMWTKWLYNPCLPRVPIAQHGEKIRMAHMWARWLHNPAFSGTPKKIGRNPSGYETCAVLASPYE